MADLGAPNRRDNAHGAKLPSAVIELLVARFLVERGPRFAHRLRERLEAKRG